MEPIEKNLAQRRPRSQNLTKSSLDPIWDPKNHHFGSQNDPRTLKENEQQVTNSQGVGGSGATLASMWGPRGGGVTFVMFKNHKNATYPCFLIHDTTFEMKTFGNIFYN